MGWLRPVILLPATAMTGLTSAQVEAIIAHELAHIRRHDYIVNLLQTVVETLLFYHPAVWWVSRQIRAEREHCCDDLAVEVCGDATGYARALAELEELRAAPEPALGAGGPLLGRVRRLLSPPTPRLDRRASWLAAALVLALLLGLGMTGHLARVAAETAAPANALAAAQQAFDRGEAAAARSANGEAIEHFDEALAHLDNVDETEAAKRLRMEVLWAKADAGQFVRGLEDSLIHLLQALALSEELEGPAAQARRTVYIGGTYANSGQQQKAEEYYRKAATLFGAAGEAAGEGECFFWLAVSQLSEDELAGERRDLDRALPLLQEGKADALAAACEAGRELLNSLGSERLKDLAGWAMTGTVLVAADGRVSFTAEPGFSRKSAGVGRLAVHNPFWQVSRLKAFLDDSVGVGESWSGEAFSYTYQPLQATVTVKSKAERVTVPAGTFANCLLTEQVTTESELPDDAPDRKKELNRSTFVGTRRAWYAPGVGLVRLEVARGDGLEAAIELREYTISGGEGYLPLAIGNAWTYGWDGVPLDAAREVYRVTSREGDTWHLAHYERITREALEAASSEHTNPLDARAGFYGEEGVAPGDSEAPPHDALRMGIDVIDLTFHDATYVAWLFGAADLPADASFPPPAWLVAGGLDPEDPTESGGTAVTEAPMKMFLPEGIEALIPVAHGSQQLVVTGTPEAIDELRELIALVDRKPQQVTIEVRGYSGRPVGADEMHFLEAEPPPGGVTTGPFLGPWEDPKLPDDAGEVFAWRVATANLSPTANTAFNSLSGDLLLATTPRINGDGTITLYIEVLRVQSIGANDDAAMDARRLASTALNVEDGEAAGLVSLVDGSWHTIIVTPHIVREAEEGD
jgi:tetratricopeptide (TPR) repeat protein